MDQDLFDGSRPGIIEIEYVSQVQPFIVNADSSSWVANDIIRSLLSLCVRDYCNTDVST